MTQSHTARDYKAKVTVKSANPNFPPGSGTLVEVDDNNGRVEVHLHFKPLVLELQEMSGLPAEQWPGTEWEYDFFEHRLVTLLKS